MATLTYRRNNVMKLSGSYLAPAASYKVVAYPAGGMITNTETVTAVTVRAGHGLAGATKVAIYRPSTSAVVSGSFQTVTVSVNTVTFGVAVATVTGDLIINVSPSDTGTSTPLWTGSTLSIYADSAGASTALTKAQVTCNASGEYEYWHNGLEIDEIIIDTLSVVTDCVPSAEQGPQMPISATDNAVVLYDGTTGRQLKNSVVIANAGALSGVTTIASSAAATILGGMVAPSTKPYNIGTWPINTVGAGTDKAPSVTELYVGSIFIPANCVVTGIQYMRSSGAIGVIKVIVSLYNSSGTKVANSATAGTTIGTASLPNRIDLTATYSAVGPAWYFVGVSFDGVTAATFKTIPTGCDGGNGVVGSAITAQVFGTLPNITPPTTFTAAVVPIASLY